MLAKVITGKQESIQVFGADYDTREGSGCRDFVHIMDIASAHILALKYYSRNDECRIFNLGSESGFTVLEIIQMLGKVCKKEICFNVSIHIHNTFVRLWVGVKEI